VGILKLTTLHPFQKLGVGNVVKGSHGGRILARGTAQQKLTAETTILGDRIVGEVYEKLSNDGTENGQLFDVMFLVQLLLGYNIVDCLKQNPIDFILQKLPLIRVAGSQIHLNQCPI
jgi:hypothetical protein